MIVAFLMAMAVIAYPHRRAGAAAALAAVVAAPGIVVALAVLGTAALLLARRRIRARADRDADGDVAVLGELVALGLSAGLTFPAALDLGAGEVAPLLRSEVAGVLREARSSGAGAILESASGRARRLYLLAGRAMVTGAPVLTAVEALVAERRDEERSRVRARARRLPVRMLFPLALLILPGFVLLTLGPALLGALERLQFPLPAAFGRLPI
jgi:tight adherence protein C